MSTKQLERADVLLVCSSGGHLAQLLALRSAWKGYSHVWVTERTPDANSLLAGENLVYAHGPAHRNLQLGLHRIARAWLLNVLLAWRLVAKVRPKVVITTGAAVAVPFAWVARLRGAEVVYVESVTRIESVSTSCRMIRPVADRVYVQWPELMERVPGSRFVGSVLGA
jgi:UDP-N-acetylglucosamine:LPS N-acetylglucosamine transferase